MRHSVAVAVALFALGSVSRADSGYVPPWRPEGQLEVQLGGACDLLYATPYGAGATQLAVGAPLSWRSPHSLYAFLAVDGGGPSVHLPIVHVQVGMMVDLGGMGRFHLGLGGRVGITALSRATDGTLEASPGIAISLRPALDLYRRRYDALYLAVELRAGGVLYVSQRATGAIEAAVGAALGWRWGW